MSENTKKFYVECECGTEVIKFEYDEEFEHWMIILYIYGRRNFPWSLRFKLIWELLVHGHIETNEIVISEEKMKKLKDYLNDKS